MLNFLQANNIMDMAEWRADWYEAVSHVSKVLETAGKLKSVLGDIFKNVGD